MEELSLRVIKDKNLDYLSFPSIEDLPHTVSRIYPHRPYLSPNTVTANTITLSTSIYNTPTPNTFILDILTLSIPSF